MRLRDLRFVVAGLTAVAASALALGCGGDDGIRDNRGGSPQVAETVPADQYMEAVCTSVARVDDLFRSELQELQSVLFTLSPEEAKTRIVRFLNDSDSAVARTRNEIEGAGIPEAVNGEPIAEALPRAFGDVRSQIKDAISEAKAISTASPAEAAAQVKTVGGLVREAGGKIATSLGEIRNSETLLNAARASQACQGLVT